MTNAFFKRQDSGLSREQVEAITEYIDQGVATKADIERLEGRLNNITWMLGVLSRWRCQPGDESLLRLDTRIFDCYNLLRKLTDEEKTMTTNTPTPRLSALFAAMTLAALTLAARLGGLSTPRHSRVRGNPYKQARQRTLWIPGQARNDGGRSAAALALTPALALARTRRLLGAFPLFAAIGLTPPPPPPQNQGLMGYLAFSCAVSGSASCAA